ncbi:MAG: geranylgeranylglyceryl/heptaprenylglyceryl phosphate synthase [Sporocytophaga sp.]|uniref:geranylgeranylglyceryl/heptaprenylglyceryl phosphate synthase n=1 Tax=Sporocytophaga sp. TaxID=2231183 RepID=UPI001B2F4159|nr:geranylgeranylglyceryl/heptaprenylglyceryl phosphate synthase [Sporocytophaga sp.]MBO9698984.1 geranylgeranylglyceryl/heptaprenylglyceryl phosphate synthase [Sporocytophaga sp.]
MSFLYQDLIEKKKKGLKSFAVLLDPDKIGDEQCISIVRSAEEEGVDYFFIGGSLMTNGDMERTISIIKNQSSIPVVIFPGSNLQIYPNADAILLLSLISGRNPEYLIGQHVVAAPLLKKSGLEVISAGYMLIDCGKPTTVSYISNTTPIPYDKPEIASCTSIAGEMLGLKLIYLEGGSGALKAISEEMVEQVVQNVNLPVIVGGGIRDAETAFNIMNAGADVIVVGNAIEKNLGLMAKIAAKKREINSLQTKKSLEQQ